MLDGERVNGGGGGVDDDDDDYTIGGAQWSSPIEPAAGRADAGRNVDGEMPIIGWPGFFHRPFVCVCVCLSFSLSLFFSLSRTTSRAGYHPPTSLFFFVRRGGGGTRNTPFH